MGFGALFLGIMLLFDSPIVVGNPPHMTVDVFPDLLGWILLFVGVSSLAKHAKGLERARWIPVGMMLFSALSLLKDTLWFDSFHTVEEVQLAQNADKVTYSISQNMAGISFDLCNHMLEILFIILLFRASAVLCRERGEDKIFAMHRNVPRIAIVEGILYTLCNVGLMLSLPKGVASVLSVLSSLDNLFMVLLVWYAAIAMVRALIRVSD